MSRRVEGKQALVTGAAQGLGAAASRMLAKEGARVLLTDINGEGAAAQAAAINREYGAGTAFSLRHDVTGAEDWKQAVELAKKLSTDDSPGFVNGVLGQIMLVTPQIRAAAAAVQGGGDGAIGTSM